MHLWHRISIRKTPHRTGTAWCACSCLLITKTFLMNTKVDANFRAAHTEKGSIYMVASYLRLTWGQSLIIVRPIAMVRSIKIKYLKPGTATMRWWCCWNAILIWCKAAPSTRAVHSWIRVCVLPFRCASYMRCDAFVCILIVCCLYAKLWNWLCLAIIRYRLMWLLLHYKQTSGVCPCKSGKRLSCIISCQSDSLCWRRNSFCICGFGLILLFV